MHGGVTARRKRNVRRVAELHRMRQERREARRSVGNVRLAAAEAGLSGRLVVEAKAISKSFADHVVVERLSTRIGRGDRVGIVGPNGAGKTTLVKMLTGELKPDAGEVVLGTNLEMIKVDQLREELNPAWTVSDALTGGRGDHVIVDGRSRHVASYMKDFLFAPEQTRNPVGVLSGGERARLMLARALAKPSNLIVVDEPTNDLDLETLDLLQELLADYSGTALIVSHDRDFLDRVVTSVIASQGDGRWIEYAGGYSDMLAQRQKPDAATGEATAGSTKDRGPSTPASPKASAAKRKLSFNEQHALRTLPGAIDALETEIEGLTKKLSDAGLYARDPAVFSQATERLAKAQAELSAAEERWLELEMLREQLEAGRADAAQD
jgi:ATP-binding cassette subfamily F protein uup